jgi:hypothetical protein
VFPARGLKPGTEVLVTTKPPAGAAIVLASRPCGSGRVLYLGADATWRWRYRFGDELHGRFWGQVVRWALASRLSAEDEHVRLGTDALTYEADGRVQVEAAIQESPGKPFEGEPVDAVVSRAGGASTAVRLALVPGSSGRYRGAFSPADLDLAPAPGNGPLELEARLDVPGLAGYSAQERKASVSFTVLPPPDREALDVARDTALLEDIAALSGGKYFPLERFREAKTALRASSRTVERVIETGLWDFPLAIACVLLGCLAAEWVLRKRMDLI